MVRRTIAISAALLLFAAMPAAAGSTGCPTAVSKVEAGARGVFKCSAGGTPTVISGRHTPLPMQTMTVTFVSTTLAKKLVDKTDGITLGSATAQGEFAIVRFTVKNNTNKPQQLNQFSQVELEIKTAQYSASLKGEDADPHQGDFNQDIEPGETGTGDVVFDVPTSAASLFPAHAGLVLVNFGHFTTFDTGQIGLLVLT